MERKIVIFLIIASLLTIVRIAAYYSFKSIVKEGKVGFVSHISTQPKVYNSYQTFSVNLPSGESVFVKTENEREYNYGDRVKLIGNLNYQVLSSGKQILAMDHPKISLENSSENPFLAVVNVIRQQISQTFYKYLPSDLAGLLLGIVIGIKVNFSSQFANSLRLSGVMHVVAASGMNVTMVGGFFFYAFSLMLRRQWAIVITICLITFYAFLAGLQPSIVRAVIMGIILFASQIWGRQNYSLYSLMLAFLGMVFVWPQYLTDVGFQLSFAATLGLLFIPQVFGRLRDFVSEDLITTVSAQAATLPILLISFGTYSIWSVIVNFLVLWTIPPLMVLGGAAAVVSLVFAPLAKWLLLLCLPLLSFFQSIITYFAGLSGVVLVSSIPWVLVAGYYLILISILIFMSKRRALNSKI
jgi:competence protein ComEC